MLLPFADCAVDLEQVIFVQFLRDTENKLEAAKVFFRDGRDYYLDEPSAVALAERFALSSTRDDVSTMARTSDSRI